MQQHDYKKTKPLSSCIKHIQIGTKMSINLHNSNQMVFFFLTLLELFKQ